MTANTPAVVRYVGNTVHRRHKPEESKILFPPKVKDFCYEGFLIAICKVTFRVTR